MITAGIDSGFQNTKVIILDDKKILSRVVMPNGWKATEVLSRRALNEALARAAISQKDLASTAATGAGKAEIPFATVEASEARCLVVGANFELPSAKTVLDMGAYKSMAARCNGIRLIRVAKNNKCAASSGIYLERLASVLQVSVEEMGFLSRQSTEKIEVLGNCAVFGESAVISLLHLRKKVPDILKGIFGSLAHQIHPLLANVGIERDMLMCGSVARNSGVVNALKKFVKIDIFVPDFPETVSALGAALIAQVDIKHSK